MNPIKTFLLVAFSLFFIFSIHSIQAKESEGVAEESKAVIKDFSIEKLRLFSEVYNKIRQFYVEEIDNEELFKNAINGMINQLDPHSTFMESKSYENLKINTVGEFGGLGITVSMENDFVKVISPIDDTPADKAGIKAGDLIILINDTRVKGLTLDEAVEIMRGKPGTEIKVSIVREGESQPLEFTIVREIIKLTSVKSRLIGKDKGYLRISHFNLNTIDEAKEKLKELNNQVEGGISGLILDLRNNPGGALKSAIEISSLFLDGGEVVSTKSRNSEVNGVFSAEKGDVLDGKPIVVMINNGSASASEIVSAALQDHNRAVIIGTTSFGKASVQTIIPLSEGSAIKLTTARYYTPSGKSIQSNGVSPDIFIPNAKLTLKEKDFQLREENLNRHLIGEDEKDTIKEDEASEQDDEQKNKEETKKEPTKPATKQQKQDDLSDAQNSLKEGKAQDTKESAIAPEDEKEVEDYMLFEATNILRGLILYHNFSTKAKK